MNEMNFFSDGTSTYEVADANSRSLLTNNAPKNLINPDYITSAYNISKTNNGGNIIVSQILEDTRDNMMLNIRTFSDDTNVQVLWGTEITSNQTVTLNFTKQNTFNRLRIGHNGAEKDANFYIDVSNLIDEKIYTLSFRILNCIQQNGVYQWDNIMIRYADITDSTFEPYYRTQKQLDSDIASINAEQVVQNNAISVLQTDMSDVKVSKLNASDFSNFASQMGQQFATLNASISTVQSNLDTESSTRYTADQALQGQINTIIAGETIQDSRLTAIENGYIPNQGNSKTGIGFAISRSDNIEISSDADIDLIAGGNLGLISEGNITLETSNLKDINIDPSGKLRIDSGTIEYSNTGNPFIDFNSDMSLDCNENDYDIMNVNNFTLNGMCTLEGSPLEKTRFSADSDGDFTINCNDFIIKTHNDYSGNSTYQFYNYLDGKITYVNNVWDLKLTNGNIEGILSIPTEHAIFYKNNSVSATGMKIPKTIRVPDSLLTSFPNIIYDCYGVDSDITTYNEFNIDITTRNTINETMTIPERSTAKISCIADLYNLKCGFVVDTGITLFEMEEYTTLTLENLYIESTDTGVTTYLFEPFYNNCIIIMKNCYFKGITNLFKGSYQPKILIIENCTFELSNQWTINSTLPDCITLIFNNNVIINGSIDFQLSTTSDAGYDGIISNNAGNLTFTGTGTGKLKLWNNSSTYTTK